MTHVANICCYAWCFFAPVFSWLYYLCNGWAYGTGVVCHLLFVCHLLLIALKLHTSFHTRWRSLTLGDLEGHWQPVRSAILATSRLLVLQAYCTTSRFCTLTSTFFNLEVMMFWKFRSVENPFNNYFIADCPNSVQAKEFWKLFNIWLRYGQWRSVRVFWDTVYVTCHDIRLILPYLFCV